ncbi:hypothetical protein DFH11DRAFT_1577794, partial [Phellopilus nigrolimitatus]
ADGGGSRGSLITTQRQLRADARRILWLFALSRENLLLDRTALHTCTCTTNTYVRAKQQRAKRGRGPDTYLIVIRQTLRSAVNITHRLIKVSARGQCPSARQALQHLYSRHAAPAKASKAAHYYGCRRALLLRVGGVAMTGAEPAVSNPIAEPTIRAGSLLAPRSTPHTARHRISLSPSVPASRGSAAARVEPTSTEKGYGAP